MTKTISRSFSLLSSALFVTATMAIAQPAYQPAAMQDAGAAATSGSTAKPDMTDKHFLKVSGESNLAEIKMAHLALEKSQSDDVKQFAQRMIDDHTKLQDQAAPVVQSLGMTPPSGPSMEQTHQYNELNKLSGKKFDDMYIKANVKDHQKVLALFKKEEADGKDPQVKQLAQSGEPIIQDHLDMAKKLASAHNVSAGSSSSM